MLTRNPYSGQAPSDDELLAALEQLEREKDELARELAERREAEAELVRQKEAAEEANRAKSDFLARMSHEIRNPMNGVIAMTELLFLTPLDEEQQSCAETLRTSGELLLEIVDDILDLSRIEAGKIKLEPRTFDLRDELESIFAVVAEQAKRKGVELSLVVDEGTPPALHGPLCRLRQVVMNLVANAVKFTRQGEVAVRVRPLGPEDGQVRLRFDVRDSGVGIDAARLEQIFLPFEQGGATAQGLGGSGLGLPICRQLVELMGGELWVKSAPGGGSTFSFTVLFSPRDAGRGEEGREAEPPEKARQEIGPPQEPPPTTCDPRIGGPRTGDPRTGDPRTGDRSRREAKLPVAAPAGVAAAEAGARAPRILVADDNPINQQVTERWLHKLGYRARVVTSGVGVLTALAKEAYDLVLMDCEMPGMDGYETTRRVRRGADQPTIPIVAMTARAMVGDRQRCLEAGMDDYLSKPVKSELLKSVLGHWLGEPAPRPPVIRPPAALPPAQPEPKPTLDPEAFRDATADLQDPRQLVEIFLRQAELGVAAIRDALAAADNEDLRLRAHNLEGSSSLLGARRFSSLCAALTGERRNGSSGDVTELCGELEAELRRVERALAAELMG